VAIKSLRESALRSFEPREGTTSSQQEQIDNMEHEATVLRSLRHPNVLPFYAFTYNPPRIITQYCPDGSLYDCLHGWSPLKDWIQKLKIVKGIAAGMRYLHERPVPICHCDLKSANILMGCCSQPIIADVGLAQIVRVEDQLAGGEKTATNINYLYHPPEVVSSKDGRAFTQKSDVYSAGIIMWEILTHKIPFDADRRLRNGFPLEMVNRHIGRDILKGIRPQIPEELTQISGWHPVLERYVALMKKCWSSDPDERPTFEQVEAEITSILEAYPQAIPATDHKSTCVLTQTSVRLLDAAFLGVALWSRPLMDLTLCEGLAYGFMGMTCATSLCCLFHHFLTSPAFKSVRSWVYDKIPKRKRDLWERFALTGFMPGGGHDIDSPFKKQRAVRERVVANQPCPYDVAQESLHASLLPDIPVQLEQPPHGHAHGCSLHQYPEEELWTPFRLNIRRRKRTARVRRRSATFSRFCHSSSGQEVSQSAEGRLQEVDHVQSTIPVCFGTDRHVETDMFTETAEEQTETYGLSCVPANALGEDEGA